MQRGCRTMQTFFFLEPSSVPSSPLGGDGWIVSSVKRAWSMPLDGLSNTVQHEGPYKFESAVLLSGGMPAMEEVVYTWFGGGTSADDEGSRGRQFWSS